MRQIKTTENSKSSGIAVKATISATSAASTDTKPPTAASEMRSKASELVLPRFDFERYNPHAPKVLFSSAERVDQLLRDKATITKEELDKKYGYYSKF
jgi:hypothetical protein